MNRSKAHRDKKRKEAEERQARFRLTPAGIKKYGKPEAQKKDGKDGKDKSSEGKTNDKD